MIEVANIVCMKWGDVYGPEYVNRLYSMVKRNITRPFRFICFTDVADGIIPEIEVFDLPPFESTYSGPIGAYRKKTLCRSDLEPFKDNERFLYLDVDVVITNNIDDMFDYMPEEDFIICYNWTRGNGKIGNSSVTMFRKGVLQYVVDDLQENFEKIKVKFKTASQEYLSSKIIEKYGKLNFWPEEWCKSFQYHSMPPRILRRFKSPKKPPAETKIFVFHGRVNPPDAIKGHWPGKYPFWKRWYKTVRPSPWLSQYYD